MKDIDWPKFIRTMRLQMCYTQRELAELVGVNKVTVCRWETGVNIPFAWHQRELIKLEQEPRGRKR